MTGASLIAIQAHQAAQEAKRIACEASVRGYAHDAATPQQMRDYAECIGLLLPVESSLFWWKVAVALLLASIPVGALVMGWRENEPVLGALLGPAVVAVIALIAYGAVFVVS